MMTQLPEPVVIVQCVKCLGVVSLAIKPSGDRYLCDECAGEKVGLRAPLPRR